MSTLTMPAHNRNETFSSSMTLSVSNSIPLPAPLINAIPAEHANRTLVVCFDGTGNAFSKENSNVVEFYSMLKKGDRTQQVVYYQPGIGTYIGRRGTSGGLNTKISELWDEAVAWNLASHVKEGYNFLMQNYINGDKISIFGFSRGAYTARALAGMLHKVGLLTIGNDEQIPFAYKMFADTSKKSWKAAGQFKDAFSIDVKIDFLGVWDTVRSVGLLDKSLPFSTSNNSIRVFRHAVSLDERRTKFQSNHWNPPSEEDAELGTQYEDDDTDVKEVWFAGAHCDVGGGGVSNEAKHSLAKIALRWMLKECFRQNTGIMFDIGKIYLKTGLTVNHLQGPALEQHESKDPDVFIKDRVVGTDEKDQEVYEREAVDLKDRMHDQLAIPAPNGWWILEMLPMHRSLDSGYDHDAPVSGLTKFIREHPINRGQGRKIPRFDSSDCKQNVFVHYTVNARIVEKDYKPLAKNWKEIESSITWTD